MDYQMYGDQDGMNPFDAGHDHDHDHDEHHHDDHFDGDYPTPQGDDGGLDVESGQMNGHMNGQMNGHMNGHVGAMMDHGQDFTPEKKLQLAERANEIYRQQLRYMQDHLASLRSLIQDKEYVIENLMLRFDLGILQEDPTRANSSLNGDDINQQELVRKAEALAQRTILENFELREMVNELRDENFHLRNEIYELQDRINRQVLQINKLEKTHDETEDDFMDDDETEDDGEDIDQPQPDDPSNSETARAIREQRAQKAHKRGQSSVVPPDMYGQDQPSGSETDEDEIDPANTATAQAVRARREAKRQHRKNQSSVAPPNMWKDGDGVDSDADSENSGDDNDYRDNETAQAVRESREAKRKHRKNQSSVAPPKGLFQSQEDSERSLSDDERDEQGTKRRGSVVEPTDPRFTDAAVAKREARQEKHHSREESEAHPDIFKKGYSPEKGHRDAANRMKKYSKEADSKRQERKRKKNEAENNLKDIADRKKHHKRKSSAHFRKLFEKEDALVGKNSLNPKDEREKELARRKSVMNHLENIGKGHLSDEDIVPKSRDKGRKVDKPQRADRYNYSTVKTRKKSIALTSNAATTQDLADATKEKGMPHVDELAKGKPSVNTKGAHHRRDSSNPVPDLGLEDAEVLLHWEKLRVRDLQEQLVKVESKLKENSTNIDKLQTLQTAVTTKEEQLNDAYVQRGELINKTSNEITRLTMILNSLLSIPKIRDIVELVIQESISHAKKAGYL